jgi:hypothetical protein
MEPKLTTVLNRLQAKLKFRSTTATFLLGHTEIWTYSEQGVFGKDVPSVHELTCITEFINKILFNIKVEVCGDRLHILHIKFLAKNIGTDDHTQVSSFIEPDKFYQILLNGGISEWIGDHLNNLGLSESDIIDINNSYAYKALAYENKEVYAWLKGFFDIHQHHTNDHANIIKVIHTFHSDSHLNCKTSISDTYKNIIFRIKKIMEGRTVDEFSFDLEHILACEPNDEISNMFIRALTELSLEKYYKQDPRYINILINTYSKDVTSKEPLLDRNKDYISQLNIILDHVTYCICNADDYQYFAYKLMAIIKRKSRDLAIANNYNEFPYTVVKNKENSFRLYFPPNIPFLKSYLTSFEKGQTEYIKILSDLGLPFTHAFDNNTRELFNHIDKGVIDKDVLDLVIHRVFYAEDIPTVSLINAGGLTEFYNKLKDIEIIAFKSLMAWSKINETISALDVISTAPEWQALLMMEELT